VLARGELEHSDRLALQVANRADPLGPEELEAPGVPAYEDNHGVASVDLHDAGQGRAMPAAESTCHAPARRPSQASSRRGLTATGQVQAARVVVHESIHRDSGGRTLSPRCAFSACSRPRSPLALRVGLRGRPGICLGRQPRPGCAERTVDVLHRRGVGGRVLGPLGAGGLQVRQDRLGPHAEEALPPAPRPSARGHGGSFPPTVPYGCSAIRFYWVACHGLFRV
jgi:hypothetical protein